MRLETTPAPSATQFADWIFSQPLGLAVLLLFVVGILTERIVTGAAYRRERERGDKLQEAVDKLSAGLNTAADTQRESLSTAKLALSLIQGIDDTLRRKGTR